MDDSQDGVWHGGFQIPQERWIAWESHKLSFQELILLAVIDGLTHKLPCCAGNARLAQYIRSTERTVVPMLSRLKKKGELFIWKEGQRRLLVTKEKKHLLHGQPAPSKEKLRRAAEKESNYFHLHILPELLIAWKEGVLKPSQIFLLTYIRYKSVSADPRDDNLKSWCKLTNEQLAQVFGVEKVTIEQDLSHLKKQGFLIIRRARDQRRMATIFPTTRKIRENHEFDQMKTSGGSDEKSKLSQITNSTEPDNNIKLSQITINPTGHYILDTTNDTTLYLTAVSEETPTVGEGSNSLRENHSRRHFSNNGHGHGNGNGKINAKANKLAKSTSTGLGQGNGRDKASSAAKSTSTGLGQTETSSLSHSTSSETASKTLLGTVELPNQPALAGEAPRGLKNDVQKSEQDRSRNGHAPSQARQLELERLEPEDIDRAKRFHDLLRRHGKHPGNRFFHTTAKPFRLLRQVNEVPGEEIDQTLTWYADNFAAKFTPKAYSAEQFRAKYEAIREAMGKPIVVDLAKVSVSAEAQRLVENLLPELEKIPVWVDQLPIFAQACLNKATPFCAEANRRLRAEVQKIPQLAPYWQEAIRYCASPNRLVSLWIAIVVGKLANRKPTANVLGSLVFDPENAELMKEAFNWISGDEEGGAEMYDSFQSVMKRKSSQNAQNRV